MKNNRAVAADREAFQRFAREYWRPGEDRPISSARPDLVGVDEIAELSGFTKNSIYTLSGRDDFPAPVARMRRRLLWARDDIIRWIEQRDCG
jgi:predicted DNA-binding transcriptional regulator AlpA